MSEINPADYKSITARHFQQDNKPLQTPEPTPLFLSPLPTPSASAQKLCIWDIQYHVRWTHFT